MCAWGIFLTIVTILTFVIVLLKVLPVPFFDSNGSTLMMPTSESQRTMAMALAEVVGNPTATLDTEYAHRFLFRDGTVVDWLSRKPPFEPMYNVVALKTVVIGFFRCFFTTPMKQASKLGEWLVSRGHRVQIVGQPDPAFPSGSVVLILSDAFEYKCQEEDHAHSGYGAAILIRRHAFLVGGQRPQIGSPF